MDAHVFRAVAQRLGSLLEGGRVEKIQSPAPQVCVISCYAGQKKYHVVLKYGRKDPFLFCAAERPVVGASPSAQIMRLRKYCAGRRIMAWQSDWVGRRISFLFQSPVDSTGGVRPPETWLTLDLREGPLLTLDAAPAPASPVRWPAPDALPAACEAWREWPVLTPALRRTLPHLDALDQAALLMDLEAGGGDTFVYAGEGTPQMSAWPLPDALRKGRTERVYADALDAAGALGGVLVLADATDKARQQAAAPYKREAARLTRLLEKIEDEERRLSAMCAAQEEALALHGVLWQYPADARPAEVATDDPRYPHISLDTRYTLRENMQRRFHTATRGRRGLPHAAARRVTLQAQLEHAQRTAVSVAQGAPLPAPLRSHTPRQETLTPRWPRGVQGFKSSDGFVLLRGRDAKGNAALLKTASGHDIWLHVEGGPSAHVIIRRSFAGEEIPDRTFQEAGVLAAVKSWQKDSPSALILCAQVRHIKPMKGAGVGTVRIDKVDHTYSVVPDPELEERLRLEA